MKLAGKPFEVLSQYILEVVADIQAHNDLRAYYLDIKAEKPNTNLNVRYPWDMFWNADRLCRIRNQGEGLLSYSLKDTLLTRDDITDAHIYTAIKRIAPWDSIA